MHTTPPRAVIYYDGQCGLCDRFVQFVLARDHAARFCFAPLQGDLARATLPALGADLTTLSTMYLTTPAGSLLARSRAAAYVLAALGFPWSVFGVMLRLLPTAIADTFYQALAAIRYRIFGRLAVCRVPQDSERARFLA